MIRSHYASATEDEILSWNWEQANSVVDRIYEDIREERRWNLLSRLGATAAGTNGGESMDYFNTLLDATLSVEARIKQMEDREAEEQAALERDRAERTAAMKERRRIEREFAERQKEVAPATEAVGPAPTPDAEPATPTPRRRLLTTM
jgi:hypothetical protein